MHSSVLALALVAGLSASQAGHAGPIRAVPGPDAVIGAPRAVPLLDADGSRVAFTTSQHVGHDIEYRVAVWGPGSSAPAVLARTRHFEGFGGFKIDALALAGDRVAWLDSATGNTTEQWAYVTSVHGDPALRTVRGYQRNALDGIFFASGPDRGGTYVGALHGSGDLIVANTWTQCDEYDDSGELDPGCTPSSPAWIDHEAIGAIVGKRLRPLYTSEDAMTVSDIGEGRLLVREDAGPVSIRTARGALLRRLDFPKRAVTGARLAGRTVVLLVNGRLAAYGLDGTPGRNCTLGPATGRVLVGAARGVAALVEGRRVLRLIRLADCAELRLAPPGATIGAADLTGTGLFYAVNRGSGSVVFVRFERLLRAF